MCNLYYFEEVNFREIKDSFTFDLLGPLIAMIILIPIPLLACHELRRKENDSSGFFKVVIFSLTFLSFINIDFKSYFLLLSFFMPLPLQRLSLAFQPTNDPICEMKRENVDHKGHNLSEEDTNSRGNLSCDIINPVISSYPLLQNLNRETTV